MKILIFFLLIFSLSFVSGLDVRTTPDVVGVNIVPITVSGITFNNNTGSVNSSDFWDNLDTPADISGSEFWYNQTTASLEQGQDIFLNLSGRNANQNINISPYNLSIGQTLQIEGHGDGNVLLKHYDIDINGNYGAIEIGELEIFQSNIAVGALNLSGTAVFRNENPDTPTIQFLFATEGGEIRFAIPKSGADFATQMARSVMVGGDTAQAFNDNVVNCSAQGYTHIDCDTSGTGADLGVQDDLEVRGKIFIEENLTIIGNEICNATDCFSLQDLNATGGGGSADFTNVAYLNNSQGFTGNNTFNGSLIYRNPSDPHRYTFDTIVRPSARHTSFFRDDSGTVTTQAPTSWGGVESFQTQYEDVANPTNIGGPNCVYEEGNSCGILIRFNITENPSMVRLMNITSFIVVDGEDARIHWWNFTSSAWVQMAGFSSSGTQYQFSNSSTAINDFVSSTGNVYFLFEAGPEEGTLNLHYIRLDILADKEFRDGVHRGNLQADTYSVSEGGTFGSPLSRIFMFTSKVSMADVGFQSSPEPNFVHSIQTNNSGTFIDMLEDADKGIRIQSTSATSSVLGLDIRLANTAASDSSTQRGVNVHIGTGLGEQNQGSYGYRFTTALTNQSTVGYIVNPNSQAGGGVIKDIAGFGVTQSGPTTDTGTRWAIWNDAFANSVLWHNLLGIDNGLTCFGSGFCNDSSIMYDGTNLVFNTSGINTLSNTTGIAYFTSAVSATNFTTRTQVYDLSLGDALDRVRTSDEYLNEDGSINHTSFDECYVQIPVTDYDRPELKEQCWDINETDVFCENVTIYPHAKWEDQVDITCLQMKQEQALAEYRSAIDVKQYANLSTPTIEGHSAIFDEIYTNSKTIEPSRDYLKDYTDEKLSEKTTHKDRITTTDLQTGEPKTLLKLEDRQVSDEGAIKQLKDIIADLEARIVELESKK